MDRNSRSLSLSMNLCPDCGAKIVIRAPDGDTLPGESGTSR